MVEQSSLQEQIKVIFKHTTDEGKDWNRNMDYWEWNSGVGLYGIIKAHKATGNDIYLNYLINWFDKNVNKRNIGSVNCVIPCNVALYLYRISGEEKYKKICDEYADWCVNKSVKTTNGGIAHVWSSGGLEDYKNQLWIDSLFMACIFMMDYGLEISDDILIESAFKQIDIHTSCQFDQEARLFYHGYHCIEERFMGEHWGRGNGWAVVTLIELLQRIPADKYDVSRYCDIFTKAMNKGYALKAENGMLHTLLDEKDSCLESTATVLFGYAALKGYEMGILDKQFFVWAEDIINNLEFTPEGIMCCASGGTDCQTKEGYLIVPYADTCYASGTALMFISQYLIR